MTIWPFRTLHNPETPFLGVVGLGWLTATIPAALIVLGLQQILPPESFEAVENQLLTEELPFWFEALNIVVVAPLLETLMMALLFFVSRKLGAGTGLQIAIQTIFWACAHGYVAFAWAFGPGWIFFVLAVMWTGQREASFGKAFWSVALVHGLNNGLAVIGIAQEMGAS